MRYSTFFKFIAIILCAASLLGMVGSAAGIIALTELGGKNVNEHYVDHLDNQALNYALAAGQTYASLELGNAPEGLLNQHISRGWESAYFDWTRVGYTITDSDGLIVKEQPVPDHGRGIMKTYTFPVMGQYMNVISAAPYEEPHPVPPVTVPSVTVSPEPGRMDAEVLVMPVQESTVVRSIYVAYSDGSQQEWHDDGTQRGALEYSGESTVTFLSNIGELPMGDGWYPTSIIMFDMGGNVVYEVLGTENVFLGSGLNDDGVIQWFLPAVNITTPAPMGITYTYDNYHSYDAIPMQGVTVTSMNVTYANAQGETLGSEGISSADLIGTLFHDFQGNAEFHSTDPMSMDIPNGCIITGITFADAQQNCIFEASSPEGVGLLTNDAHGYLVFRGQMPGTVIPDATEPEADSTEAAEEPEGQTGFARETLSIHRAPSMEAQIVGTVEAWDEVTVLKQETFEGKAWGLIPGGWVPMDQILTEETTASFWAIPRLLEDPLPDTAPEESLSDNTEPTDVPAETLPVEAAAVTAAEEPSVSAQSAAYPEEDIETQVYYDGQTMLAGYVWETIPDGYTVTVSLAPGALRNELVWTLLRLADAFRPILLEVLGVCIAVFVLCLVHLCCSAGRTRRNNEVRAGGLNRIPLDLYLAGSGSGIVGLVAAAIYGSEYFARNDEQLAIIFCGACAYSASLLLVAFFFAFVAQIKTPGGYWWRNTFCGWCIRFSILACTGLFDFVIRAWRKGVPSGKKVCGFFWHITRSTALWLWDTGKRLLLWLADLMKRCFVWTTERLVRFFGMLPITWQFLTTGFTLVFLLYVMMRTYKVGYILLGFGIFFAVILYAASAFAILLENARRMSRGDLDSKVDDRMLIGGFREFAERLNDLAGVAVIAAQKQLKSERMKTELITNVSHDIKTPLTSIINYVDLLQKPHTEQQQEQYLEVLARQSQRLKKLIDDLMEMSKASTGNTPVDITTVDAAEAVNQALGEFADKLERAQLMPVFRQPEEQVLMLADGKLVWRVMSNLLGNAVKYALPGTRIYIDLLEMEGKVIISLKNISREELNVHADELMERFVRGDASRNTEGSGLGLNIAQSLMELQRGQLQILVDGDLFKVTLIFPRA